MHTQAYLVAEVLAYFTPAPVVRAFRSGKNLNFKC